MEFGRLNDYFSYKSFEINDDKGDCIGCVDLDNEETEPVFIAAESEPHAFTISELSAIIERMRRLRDLGR